MGDFDSVKIGVCDAYWTPASGGSEVFLGLTKGGVELSYTPEWYDIQVDRYGNTQIDSSLVGEAVSVKIPLAETDLNKIEMFAHTATVVYGSDETQKKLTFGKFPGFRLGQKAGRLRLHPVASGSSKEDDVVIYKSVNKAPLQLNYKIDEERVFQTEFIGMVKRQHINGALLWEIGDSTIGTATLELSPTLDADGLPTNLLSIVELSGSQFWVSPQASNVYTESTDEFLRTTRLQAYVEFNGNVFNVTKKVTFTLPSAGGVSCNLQPVVDGTNLPSVKPNLVSDAIASNEVAAFAEDGGQVVVHAWSALSLIAMYKLNDGANPELPESWSEVGIGDTIRIKVNASFGTLTSSASVVADIVP